MTLMPEFRRQLLEAAASRAHEPGRRHRGFGLPRSGLGPPRPRLGAPIAAAASILVVAAVVAVVLTLGHAHHGAGTPGGQRNGSEVPGVSAARAELLAELGALRRGHAPKLAAHVALPESHLQIDRSLVRIVRTGGYKMTLLPASHAVRGSASSHRTTGLVVTVRGPKVRSGFPAIGEGSFTVDSPVSPGTLARQGTILVAYVSGPLNRAVVIVPDGVTRVQLSRFEPDSSSGGRIAAIAHASAPVHDNVAVIALPGVTTTALHQTQRTLRGNGGLFSRHHCRVNAALYFVPVSVHMTWWRKTDTGSEAHATTGRTSLNAYSTTLLPHAPCRRSPNR
jgi:hypothetical protein